MRLLFLLSVLSTIFFSVGDVGARYYTAEQIENYVNQTPRNYENNLTQLVRYLIRPFDNQYDQAKAIAFWIAGHISYDNYIYNDGQRTRLGKYYKGQTPQELLQSRVGICGDFTNLFAAMCNQANIRVYNVHGYAYPKSERLTSVTKKNSRHAWSYFEYRGKRVYVDTTFMAKGRTGVQGYASDFRHRQALNKIQKANKRISQVNPIDDFYFDFYYSSEQKYRNYKRVETSN